MLPMGALSAPGVPQPYSELRALAQKVESSGLDTVWVYDHLLGGGPEEAIESPWEAWTVLTGLAEATSTVRLGALVFCTAFRPPAVFARMADTLQDISGDRLILGLGAGWHQPEFDAFGIPFDHRVGRFEEATEILTRMLRDGRATFEGQYRQVTDAPVRERPGRVPPTILVAAKSPRMLALTARYADSWNLAWYGDPDDAFREANRALSEACTAAGRDPATLERTAGILVGHDIERSLPVDADRLAEAFAAWEAEGVAELVCSPNPCDAATIEVIAEARRRIG